MSVQTNFQKISKNLTYRKCKNLAHYLAKLNGLKWAKLGAEAKHEWLTPAMLYASTPLPVSTFLAKLGPCAESYVEKCPFRQILDFRQFQTNLYFIFYRCRCSKVPSQESAYRLPSSTFFNLLIILFIFPGILYCLIN